MYVCMYVCMYVYVYVYTHTHTHTHHTIFPRMKSLLTIHRERFQAVIPSLWCFVFFKNKTRVDYNTVLKSLNLKKLLIIPNPTKYNVLHLLVPFATHSKQVTNVTLSIRCLQPLASPFDRRPVKFKGGKCQHLEKKSRRVTGRCECKNRN